ncbi:MAG: energy transducer TonB [Terriglobales bacterium]
MGSSAVKPVRQQQGEVSHDFMPSLFGLEYATYGTKPTNFLLSFLLHTLMAAGLVLSTTFAIQHRQEIKATVTTLIAADISPYVLPAAKDRAGGGGGGGDRDKLAASKGNLPKFARDQFTPPVVVIRNPDPKLPMEPTVVVPPEIRMPTGGQLGDPMSNILGPASNGTGSGGGIGSGSGGGVGSGRGPGVGPGWGGGIGGGPYRVGGGVSAPRLLFDPEPEYSEEARKAKYQGTVVLWVVVGPDGRAHEIRPARTLGMGLDEKAIEAVRRWKFEPARKDGVPVAVQINVEVNFRLY